MAHHQSAKKRIRQTAKRTEMNKSRISRIRTHIRKVERALAASDGPAAREAFKEAEPEIMRGVSKGVLQKNTAARKVSRLAKKVGSLENAASS